MDVNTVIERLQVPNSARIACPDCSNERSKRNEKDLAVHKTNDGWRYFCHHCNASGFVPFDNKRSIKERELIPAFKPQLMPPLAMGALKPEHLKFLENRGISATTAEEFSLFATDKYFGRMGKTAPALGFPYYRDGKLTAAKYRALESKEFTQDAGGAQDFFGLDKVDPTKPLVIVEGEMDALAAFEAGIENVVSVPAGAPMKVKDGRIDASEDAKFSFVWNSFELLKAVPHIVIATDSDTAGQALAEELARRIGKARCRLATLPEKDINDLFLKEGADAVRDVLARAEPYPVEGLSQPSKYFDRLNDLWVKGTGEGTSTGYSNVDEIYTVAPGQLTIVTGYPSSGKSNFVDQLMINLGVAEDWKFAVCSFENQPEIHITRLMELYTKRRFFEGTNRMTDVEKNEALAWVESHFLFLDSETVEPSTIESVLERASIAVARLGIRGLVIDPYNYIENRTGTSETEFISSMLTRVQAFAKAFGVHVWFVAHPAKITRANMDLPRPDGMSISGSMAWWAKADCGLTVHRGEGNEVQIAVWKCRYRWVGTQGETTLTYNKIAGNYTEPDAF
jgi:twinkle protein